MLSIELKNLSGSIRLLLTISALFTGFSQVKGQRVYADNYAWYKTAVVIASSSVTTPENAIGVADNKSADLAVVTVAGAATAEIQLKYITATNPTLPLPSGTKIYIRVDGSLSTALLGLLTGGSGNVYAYSGATTASQTAISGTVATATLSGFTGSDTYKYAVVTTNTNTVNAVGLKIDAALVVGGGNLNVFHSFYIAPPTFSNLTICGGESVNVSNAQSGFTYNWWTAATGGTIAHTGSSITPPTPASQTTYTYYVSANDGTNFSSIRVPITITVNPRPAVPAGTAPAICAGNNGVFNVTSPTAGYTYNWYATSTGGSPISTGTSVNTASALSTNLTYYLEATTTATGCKSASRTAVTVTVNPLPGITLGNSPSACIGAATAPLSYTATTGTPNTYSITWNAAALAAGFSNVQGLALPASPVTLNVPATAVVTTYTGTLTVKNANGCVSSSQNINLFIRSKPPHPSVNITSN